MALFNIRLKVGDRLFPCASGQSVGRF